MNDNNPKPTDIHQNKGARWHSPIDLGDGTNTNPRVLRRFNRRLRLMQIPHQLSGKNRTGYRRLGWFFLI